MSQAKVMPSRTEEIIAEVNKLGLVKAAEKLGIPQVSLHRFIHRQGYRRKAQYVKEAQTLQTT